ncbi:MAG TPA: LLM class flavin-dependent oxidoreductase [Chloroflexota bacterium]|nr:LLM class flavin-dependent oxidoreductase [Chloroflexota bacterium]
MTPVQLYSWHFMPYPYLPPDFDEKYDSGWVTVPNSLWDRERARGLYQEYIDELAYADQLGFDGLVLNEHHQNIYGLMPSPNLIAAALTQRTVHGRLVVLGNLLPLHGNPMRIAEEYAMLDNMSNGRLVAGFAVGGGQEMFNYNHSPSKAREQFWEAADLIVRAWTEDGPFEHDGKYYPLRYVNCWPRPLQQPHPPVWVPGATSLETMAEVAKRGYTYFLSSRSRMEGTAAAARRFAEVVEGQGGKFHPFRMGLLVSVYVAETDEQARAECENAIWYFLKNTFKGHLRRNRGRVMTAAPGATSPRSWEAALRGSDPTAKMLGDAENWDDIERMGSIIVGSPETVRRRLWQYITEANLGLFLIQFHIGNMGPELTNRSQRLFAEQVAPSLREESAAYFAAQYPELSDMGVPV